MLLQLPRHRHLDLSRPKVMGILNITPDSFSDGGRFIGKDAALAEARAMLAAGAADFRYWWRGRPGQVQKKSQYSKSSIESYQ